MSALVDTHCHLDAPEFARDATDVRARAARAGVAHCVIPAVHTAAFDAVRELAHRGGDSYALGIHPLFTPRAEEADLRTLDRVLTEHADDPRLVAVGEIGLDHFVPGLDRERQEFFYREQLRLARRHGLPVVLHKLGFGGAVTYERALQLRRLAASLPLSALVLETDAPDIPPHWLYRTAEERAQGTPQGRNEPAELPRIAQVVAELRGMPVEELAEATTRNAIEALPKLGPLLSDNPPP